MACPVTQGGHNKYTCCRSIQCYSISWTTRLNQQLINVVEQNICLTLISTVGVSLTLRSRTSESVKFDSFGQQQTICMENMLNINTSSTCPDNMVNFGAPQQISTGLRLGSVTARHLVVNVSQTLRRWTEGTTYVRQGDHHVGHWPTF